MGVGIAYGQGDHGFAGLSDIDGNGGRAAGLAHTGLHRIGEQVSKNGAEIDLGNG